MRTRSARPLRPRLMGASMGILIAASTAHAASPAELFAQANAAYEAGDYGQAKTLYTQLQDRGYSSGWLSYDLGAAALRDGEVGEAVAHFRRAKAQLPRHGDVKANLAFARSRTQDAIAPPEPAPWVHALCFWHYVLSYQELVWTVMGLNIAFFSALGLLRFRPELEIGRWASVLLGIGLVATGTSFAIKTFWPTHLAVVTRPEITVHSGTHRDTVVRFKLHNGTEATVIGRDAGWYRIELSDGKGGWVSESDVTLVSL
ncbi:MAG TPA: SH3 domain-containing protein [Myxococcota bacterium]|nr:SH3 domain-containing protein [Myxococcota bacterium]